MSVGISVGMNLGIRERVSGMETFGMNVDVEMIGKNVEAGVDMSVVLHG